MSEEAYVEKVLDQFNMSGAKSVLSLLAKYFKLTKEQSPNSEKDQVEMSKILYASSMGSLMHAMVCTWPNIAHVVSVISRFLSILGKKHWEVVK